MRFCLSPSMPLLPRQFYQVLEADAIIAYHGTWNDCSGDAPPDNPRALRCTTEEGASASLTVSNFVSASVFGKSGLSTTSYSCL